MRVASPPRVRVHCTIAMSQLFTVHWIIQNQICSPKIVVLFHSSMGTTVVLENNLKPEALLIRPPALAPVVHAEY